MPVIRNDKINIKEDNINENLIVYVPFDEGVGKKTKEMVSGKEYEINYVFNDAKYKPDSAPRWLSGIKGNGLIFDGYSNSIKLGEDFFEKEIASMTITAWLAPRSFENPEETPGGDKLCAVVNQHNLNENRGFILGLSKHGSWSFQLGLGDETVSIWDYNNCLPAYNWSFITAVYDSKEGFLKLYFDGKLVAENKIKAGKIIKTADVDLLIGQNNNPDFLADVFTMNMYDGLMDELKIYDKALKSEEVKEAYNSYLIPYQGQKPDILYSDLTLDPEVYHGDKHRPQYHIIAPGHWMNEPHGPIYYNGKYHLFYQHNPRGPYWHNIHWGHMTSTDMVHWHHLPIALTPEKDNVDPDGDWSGSATYDPDGFPAIFLTAGNKKKTPDQGVAIATPVNPIDDNDLVEWAKPSCLDIEQPQGIGLTADFRDPFPWKEGDEWFCLVGSGIKNDGGTALLFKSDDFQNWEFIDHLYRTDYQKYPYLGPVWELPVLLPLGKDKTGKEKHIFLISPVGKGADVEVFYWIGSWDKENGKFVPDDEEPQLIDYGDFHFTGPSGMVDPVTGRKIIFTIAQGDRYPQAEYDAGWAHNGGLPLSIYLRDDGQLGIEPIKELESLRQKKLISLQDTNLSDVNKQLQQIRGDMLEIKVEIDPLDANNYGIKVRKSPAGEEETLLFYDRALRTININRENTSLDPEVKKTIMKRGPIKGGKLELSDNVLRLHIYIDKSMIECYANSLKNITSRVYPDRDDSDGLEIWADDDVIVKNLDIWEMNSAYVNNYNQ